TANRLIGYGHLLRRDLPSAGTYRDGRSTPPSLRCPRYLLLVACSKCLFEEAHADGVARDAEPLHHTITAYDAHVKPCADRDDPDAKGAFGDKVAFECYGLIVASISQAYHELY